MDNFHPSILEYLGKIENGILVLIGITYQNQYWEATFFYNESDIILTISEEFEEVIGDITKHPNYSTLIKDILKRIVPYNEMINSIDNIDFGRWVKPLIEMDIIKTDTKLDI